MNKKFDFKKLREAEEEEEKKTTDSEDNTDDKETKEEATYCDDDPVVDCLKRIVVEVLADDYTEGDEEILEEITKEIDETEGDIEDLVEVISDFFDLTDEKKKALENILYDDVEFEDNDDEDEDEDDDDEDDDEDNKKELKEKQKMKNKKHLKEGFDDEVIDEIDDIRDWVYRKYSKDDIPITGDFYKFVDEVVESALSVFPDYSEENVNEGVEQALDALQYEEDYYEEDEDEE